MQTIVVKAMLLVRNGDKLLFSRGYDTVKKEAKELGYTLQTFQSNHEDTLIDFIQKHSEKADGILINPGALTHYSYALHDAILDAKIPAIEVHLSDIKTREVWRKKSLTPQKCFWQILL